MVVHGFRIIPSKCAAIIYKYACANALFVKELHDRFREECDQGHCWREAVDEDGEAVIQRLSSF